MIIMCAALAVFLLFNGLVKLADHELVFGGATIFVTLTLLAAFISVFLRRHVEDQAGWLFALLAALSVLFLVLAAFDWGRPPLLIAATVAALGLSLFIVRVGFETLKVPPQWERTQIATETRAEEDALQHQSGANITALMATAVNARTALDDLVNGSQPLTVSSTLRASATKILNQGFALIPREEAENPDDFSEFDIDVANEDPTKYPPGATAKLADAVHALQTAETAAAVKPTAAALNQAIDNVESGAITANKDWVTAQHRLDVELATYRAQVTGTRGDQSALQAVLAQQPDADQDISVLSAAENGPQTLWRSAFHASGPALVPGPLGWALLGAALLGLFSWLLRHNARQLAGPVSVTPVGAGNDNDQLTAALRVAVLQNVAEPGAAPGSPSINPVTTLLGIAGDALSPVSKIIQAVQAVAGQRYGYQVAIDVTTGDLADPSLATGGAGTAKADTPGVTSVLVRVMSVNGGITYSSHLCESADKLDAVRTAGFWAAGDILNRSSRIPHWAAWQAETAHALVTAKSRSEHTITDLKAALAIAPNSGILLVLLGHRYELADRPLEAIECYARAVTAYPRYAVARYRLGIALGGMRHGQFAWRHSEAAADDEDSMLRAVQSAVRKLRVNDGRALSRLLREGRGREAQSGLQDDSPPENVKPKKTPEEKAEAEEKENKDLFEKLACRLLRSLQYDTLRIYYLPDLLRRSERKSVWPALVPLSKHPAARFHVLVKSAGQALAPDDRDWKHRENWKKLDKRAEKDGSWWQISYNAACCHADKIGSAADGPGRNASAREALGFLEQTLVRPGVEQLSAAWVNRDPDLAALQPFPRFKRFLAQLRPGE